MRAQHAWSVAIADLGVGARHKNTNDMCSARRLRRGAHVHWLARPGEVFILVAVAAEPNPRNSRIGARRAGLARGHPDARPCVVCGATMNRAFAGGVSGGPGPSPLPLARQKRIEQQREQAHIGNLLLAGDYLALADIKARPDF